jgi:hypothetical protein
VTANSDLDRHLRQESAVTESLAADDLRLLDLPQVFSPTAAAALLRDAGLAEMTECALRARAYRRQIPFHRNGRRIVFTLSDLRKITAGEPHTPEHRAEATGAAKPAHRRPPPQCPTSTADPWRARRPAGCRARTEHAPAHTPRSATGTAEHRDTGSAPRHRPRSANRTVGSSRTRRTHGSGA